MDNQKTGRFIAEQRKTLGLTQKQLADILHISDRAVSRWERGVGFPDISLMEPLADALSVSILELLHGESFTDARQDSSVDVSVRDALRIISRHTKRKLRCIGDFCKFAAIAFSLFLVLPVLMWFLLFYRPMAVAVSAADWQDIEVQVTSGNYGIFSITDREEIEAFADQLNAANYRKLVFQYDGEAPDSLMADIAPIGIGGHSVMRIQLCGSNNGTVFVSINGIRMKEFPSAGPLYNYLSKLLENQKM